MPWRARGYGGVEARMDLDDKFRVCGGSVSGSGQGMEPTAAGCFRCGGHRWHLRALILVMMSKLPKLT